MQRLRTEPKPPLAWRIANWWVAAVIVAFVIVRVLGPHFADAGKQAAQWAYPETCVLGRNAGHPHVWTPDEVWPILAGLLAAAREPLA